MEVAIRMAGLLRDVRATPSRSDEVRPRAGARPARPDAAAAYAGLVDAALHRDLGALRAYGALIAEGGLELDLASAPPACASFE